MRAGKVIDRKKNTTWGGGGEHDHIFFNKTEYYENTLVMLEKWYIPSCLSIRKNTCKRFL